MTTDRYREFTPEEEEFVEEITIPLCLLLSSLIDARGLLDDWSESASALGLKATLSYLTEGSFHVSKAVCALEDGLEKALKQDRKVGA